MRSYLTGSTIHSIKGIDIVLHQAALPSVPHSIIDPITTNEINVNGTLNVLNAAKENSIKRIVFDSSSSVYGDSPELPKHDFYLGVGSGSHAEQTAKVMIEFEKVLLQEKPDLVIVYGDVNSTVACALTAVKMNIKVAHVEAGLRSFDRTMPEEINRILTDSISDYLFVTEKSGVENLKREGISEDKIFLVGNTMIDSLIEYLPKAERSNILKELKLSFNHTSNQASNHTFL